MTLRCDKGKPADRLEPPQRRALSLVRHCSAVNTSQGEFSHQRPREALVSSSSFRQMSPSTAQTYRIFLPLLLEASRGRHALDNYR